MKVMINKNVEGEWDGKLTKCRGCGDWIAWALLKSGKKISFNRDETYSQHIDTCRRKKEE